MPGAGAPPRARKREEGRSWILCFCSPPAFWLVPALLWPHCQLSSPHLLTSCNGSLGSGCSQYCHRQPQNYFLQNLCIVFTHVAGWEWASSPLLWENHRAISSWKKVRKRSAGEGNCNGSGCITVALCGTCKENAGNQSKSMSRTRALKALLSCDQKNPQQEKVGLIAMSQQTMWKQHPLPMAVQLNKTKPNLSLG